MTAQQTRSRIMNAVLKQDEHRVQDAIKKYAGEAPVHDRFGLRVFSPFGTLEDMMWSRLTSACQHGKLFRE